MAALLYSAAADLDVVLVGLCKLELNVQQTLGVCSHGSALVYAPSRGLNRFLEGTVFILQPVGWSLHAIDAPACHR